MKLKAGASVIAAGLVEFGGVVVVVTDEGATKVTELAEIPAKGRATGGVRVVRFKGFETLVAYGWVGRNQQLGAIVSADAAGRQPDPTPVPITLEPSRRDGAAVDLGYRILNLGEYRFR